MTTAAMKTGSHGTLARFTLAGVAVVAVALAGCDKPSGAPAPAAETTTHGARVDATGRHRVVFEITTDDHDQWEGVLNNAENVKKALGPDRTDVAVVGHGNGLSMLLAANAPGRARMEELARAVIDKTSGTGRGQG